jgi:hypothetical protein
MEHAIVTRFSVPRPEPDTAGRHANPAWLEARLALFRRFYVPSVERLGVPAILLCSSASAAAVAQRLADLPWLQIAVQDAWHGGWTDADRMLTRLDSDDALHEDWFAALERAPRGFEAYGSRSFLRLDLERRRLHRFRRRAPAPLAAFAPGINPFHCDHAALARRHVWHELEGGEDGAWLLQVVHGGNVASRRPRWWRLHPRLPLDRLAPFGVTST